MLVLCLSGCGAPSPPPAPALADEDGYELWLRYRPAEHDRLGEYRRAIRRLTPMGESQTIQVATAELTRGVSGLLDQPVGAGGLDDGSVVYGTPTSSRDIASLDLPLSSLGPEGYLIRSAALGGHKVTVIAANTDIGVLYGAFALLRQMQTAQSIVKLDLSSTPKLRLRVLNHWDNLNRTVERGYAGESIWDWQRLPGFKSELYTDYARANASLGVNGTVLNNVNSNADILQSYYLEKVAALADVFRPYGIKVYLSARFSAPMEIGGLKTADPLDPAVTAWWKTKVDEIYTYIPDFGGFLVKANSEGQPGPQDYHRTHADGANMLADALAPHGGVVMWRAFVYASAPNVDRAMQAYDEFKPLDGKFRDNVLVQVKNGAIDFQPREPFHPLFGAMPKTPLMMEFQITKEYLGFSTHLVYLGPLYEEALRADTWTKGKGSTVARVIDGSLDGHTLTGMAGVANIGSDRNWSGSHFDQANWYVFGRMAWDPDADAKAVAEDWARMTFSDDPRFVGPTVDMMMASREAVVDYMTPLGLTHLMETGHHYGPGPWVDDAGRADWNPVYFHRADDKGIGFDRTSKGSNAVSQYAPEVATQFEDPATTPENFLLWFHHLPWTYQTASGRTLWEELVARYNRGVASVASMQAEWERMAPYIDARRHREVVAFLAIQLKEAQWWRDACIAYFQSRSRLPLPAGVSAPPHDVAWYKAIELHNIAGHGD